MASSFFKDFDFFEIFQNSSFTEHLRITTFKLFDDGDPYHIETSPFIYSANQWTGFYMIGTSVIKELNIL